jgi:hypothetical protein
VLAIRKTQISSAQKLYTCTVKNGYSAGNYQLLDKESTGRMEFCWELPAPKRGIHRKNGILSGITGFWTRNPREEGNLAGNYRLLNEESTGRMEFRQELLAHCRGFRPARSKIFHQLQFQDLYRIKIIFINLNMKTKYERLSL